MMRQKDNVNYYQFDLKMLFGFITYMLYLQRKVKARLLHSKTRHDNEELPTGTLMSMSKKAGLK